MRKIKEVFDYYFNIICTFLLIFMISGICFLIYKNIVKEDDKSINNKVVLENAAEENTKEDDKSSIKVDIKGAVKNPSVYEIESNKTISDLIELAGGITKNATTDNINLSRKLEDQMVVRIFTKSQLKKKDIPTISECVCKDIDIKKCEDNSITKIDGENINAVIASDEETNSNNQVQSESSTQNSGLISINTASKEQLMTLSGVGESKAIAIIEYREKNGGFKAIEDIKNVTGIGDALFEKIKDSITL